MSGFRNSPRGKIYCRQLKRSITFNGVERTHMEVELDHINHGLHPRTKKLKKTKRFNFNLSNIESFLRRLDNEYLDTDDYRGTKSVFTVVIDCPVKGKWFEIPFICIIAIDHNSPDYLFSISMWPK